MTESRNNISNGIVRPKPIASLKDWRVYRPSGAVIVEVMATGLSREQLVQMMDEMGF